ncbi:MAG TPA: hypothetical protein VL588_00205 [Bdellovibrionota bacterium]|nr:hypothetical protein [Bdellovibrionota bacterium]
MKIAKSWGLFMASLALLAAGCNCADETLDRIHMCGTVTRSGQPVVNQVVQFTIATTWKTGKVYPDYVTQGVTDQNGVACVEQGIPYDGDLNCEISPTWFKVTKLEAKVGDQSTTGKIDSHSIGGDGDEILEVQASFDLDHPNPEAPGSIVSILLKETIGGRSRSQDLKEAVSSLDEIATPASLPVLPGSRDKGVDRAI